MNSSIEAYIWFMVFAFVLQWYLSRNATLDQLEQFEEDLDRAADRWGW